MTAQTDRTAIARQVTAYTPTTLSPREWDLAAPAVRQAVQACGPRTSARAVVLLGALTAFLAGPSGWDRVSEPDLGALLTEPAIDRHIAAVTGSAGSRSVHRVALRKVASALGRPIPVKQTRAPRSATTGGWAVAALTAGEPVHLVNAVWVHHCGQALPESVLRRAVAALLRSTRSTVTDVAAGTVRAPDTNSVLAAAPDRTMRTAQVDATGTPQPAGTARPRPVTTKKPLSRRQALAFARANQAIARGPVLADPVRLEDVDPSIVTVVHAYRPARVDKTTWAHMRDLHNRLVFGYHPTTADNAQAICSHLARFLAWFIDWPGRPTPGQPIGAHELLRDGLVEAYLHACPPSPTSRATIRAAVRRALGALHAHGRPQRLARTPVATPYTPDECRDLVHLARNQPTQTRRRHLSFIVGLGLGAGLDGRELKDVHARDIAPVTFPSGQVLTVATGTSRARRVVPVRTKYAPLVLEALALHEQCGGEPGDRILPGSSTARACRRAVTADTRTGVRVDSYRLRNAWLLALMCAPVPLADLLAVAGLQSARTLTDLLTHCPPPNLADLAGALARIDTGEPR